jgi:hypothetical protein
MEVPAHMGFVQSFSVTEPENNSSSRGGKFRVVAMFAIEYL